MIFMPSVRTHESDLWMPITLSCYATWEYSRIRLPSQSLRRTRALAPRESLVSPSAPASSFWRAAARPLDQARLDKFLAKQDLAAYLIP